MARHNRPLISYNFRTFFSQASPHTRLSTPTASESGASQTSSAHPLPTGEESAKKRNAISRIFSGKKATPTSGGGKGGHQSPMGSAGGKSGVKVEVKTEPTQQLTPSAVASAAHLTYPKRLDGRPIIMCRIPMSALSNRSNTPRHTQSSTPTRSGSGSGSGSKKRERKLSTASSAASTSASVSKRHKKSKKEDFDIRPEATNLMNLPGYSGSNQQAKAEVLMPPPDKKIESDIDLNLSAASTGSNASSSMALSSGADGGRPSLLNSCIEADEFSVSRPHYDQL